MQIVSSKCQRAPEIYYLRVILFTVYLIYVRVIDIIMLLVLRKKKHWFRGFNLINFSSFQLAYDSMFGIFCCLCNEKFLLLCVKINGTLKLIAFQ